MDNVTNEQLDSALLDTLRKPVNTEFERFEQVLRAQRNVLSADARTRLGYFSPMLQ